MTNDTTKFLETLHNYYYLHQREMPWRITNDPYKIMVSEIMLQQTQVNRVIPKFEQFISTFPTVAALANAELAEVLSIWSGLGYNRRAKFLHQAAQKVVADFNGVLPKTSNELVSLPGVGKNTAGAIMAYAHNQPVVFIETNIRTVLFHHYFAGKDEVSDKQLEEVLSRIMKSVDDPRNFYWAMMDYGTHLKITEKNIHRSKHYTKQSKFAGSKRQVRGQIIKLLVAGSQTRKSLQSEIDDERCPEVLEDLLSEQLIVYKNNRYSLG